MHDWRRAYNRMPFQRETLPTSTSSDGIDTEPTGSGAGGAPLRSFKRKLTYAAAAACSTTRSMVMSEVQAKLYQVKKISLIAKGTDVLVR